MAITLRNVTGSELTHTQLDDNFLYLSASYTTTSSFHSFTSSYTTITGSLTVSGSLASFNFISGSRVFPTASVGDSLRPTFSGSEGQFLFGSGSQGYKLWAWIGGSWRSGSMI